MASGKGCKAAALYVLYCLATFATQSEGSECGDESTQEDGTLLLNTVKTNFTGISTAAWLEVLGLQGIRKVGALLVRGYLFQSDILEDPFGIDIVPDLETIGSLIPVMINNVRLPPLSILGAVVPRLNSILTLEAGIFIENTPNVNFTDNFRALGEIAGPVVIVGNPQLTSLDGLQSLTEEEATGQLKILGNPMLTDPMASPAASHPHLYSSPLPPASNKLWLQVIPEIPVPPGSSCFLLTAEQACQFIGNNTCPAGTLYDGGATSRLPENAANATIAALVP